MKYLCDSYLLRSSMAIENIRRLAFVVLFCICFLSIFASPTRKLISESSTSSYAGITNDGVAAWDDSDDFDFNGGEWTRTSSPPPLPEYEDYADDEEEEGARQEPGPQEFLFAAPKDSGLLFQDDGEQTPSSVKVRHNGKTPYSDSADDSPPILSNDLKDDSQQFEFTIDDNDGEDKDDDFVLDDSSDEKKAPEFSKEPLKLQDVANDDEDDDDAANGGEDEDGDSMFDSPEEDAQVIYGDHVFLY